MALTQDAVYLAETGHKRQSTLDDYFNADYARTELGMSYRRDATIDDLLNEARLRGWL